MQGGAADGSGKKLPGLVSGTQEPFWRGKRLIHRAFAVASWQLLWRPSFPFDAGRHPKRIGLEAAVWPPQRKTFYEEVFAVFGSVHGARSAGSAGVCRWSDQRRSATSSFEHGERELFQFERQQHDDGSYRDPAGNSRAVGAVNVAGASPRRGLWPGPCQPNSACMVEGDPPFRYGADSIWAPAHKLLRTGDGRGGTLE